MIRKQWICLLLALLLLCPLYGVSAEGAEEGSTWICLVCGTEAESISCPCCAAVRDVWICSGCGTRNLSAACRSCGRDRADSLRSQAFSGDPLKAFPALRYLAGEGENDAKCALADYYLKGMLIPQDTEAAIALYREAGEAGYGPALLQLGKLYDSGGLVQQDLYQAMEYFQQAAGLGVAEAWWS